MRNSIPTTIHYPVEKNRVLDKNFRASDNFFRSDKIFGNYFKNNISSAGAAYMNDKLDSLGNDAAGIMNELSMAADKSGPVLVKRNSLGENIDEISFHPAYWELMKIAVRSEMMRVKWDGTLRNRFGNEIQRLGFAAGYFYAMSECGQYCPLCMTDGAARLIDLFCNEEDKARLLAHVSTNNAADFFTGAMFLTEKTGGSDVGANITTAVQHNGDSYLLNGEKWFCSNANADLIFALARTDDATHGIKGLSIFLIEKYLRTGEKNSIEMIRIKEKLGVRSMASAECMLTDTYGKLVGKEFEGFKVMVEMISLSRLYNSIAALACSRRALIEAYQFISNRKTFGKPAIEHSLIRTKLTELGALHVANFYLVWRTTKALDLADTGNETEAQLFRLLNPMTKKLSAETGVYMTRESMELMGGLGYIEDTVMPKLLRDIMVLPIWEGSGNIIILDMLRSLHKTKGFEVMCDEIVRVAQHCEHEIFLLEEVEKMKAFSIRLKGMRQDEMESSAKMFFEKLTSLFQVALLADAINEESKQWIEPTIDFLKKKYLPAELTEEKPLSVREINQLIGWD